MKPSQEIIEFIKSFEKLRLNAYYATQEEKERGIATIGYGNTRYESGVKVKITDKITKQRAEELFSNILNHFALNLNKVLKVPVTQRQFDSLLELYYNIGHPNFSTSTLLRKVNTNPNDVSIAKEIQKWVFQGKKKLDGLVKRRTNSALIYTKGIYINHN